ncbi:MAG: hypothetical protein IRY90_20625, partial [Actinomadura rubrobrunea]|nr:hypothetical protein [Actinomadura rubrobrunea]
QDTAERFLAAWERGDLDTMRRLTADPPADFRERFARMRDDLGLVRQRYRVTAIGDPEDGAASGSFHAELTLADGRVWTYTGTLPFTKRDDAWFVAWSPRVVHPMLREGQRLRAARVWPDRAAVQAADGSDLDAVPSGSVQQIVGSLGKIDAKTARELGPPYRAGDLAGVDGLQRQYEKRLAGTPALAVQIVDADGGAVRTLHRFGGTPGAPLRTTIDPKAQRAASRALADVDKTASLVAVRASTGEILAVANKPGGYNRALMGRYPPGSTFKVVTAAALVADGLSVTSPVACPATTDVGGRTFKNYRHEDFGTVPFREAFAHSCNTTFARLAVDRLGPRRLAQVAEQFGFNAPIIGGLPAVRASFPAVKDDTAFAAASFGQGEVLTSPLN